jgi:hypothetical protein
MTAEPQHTWSAARLIIAGSITAVLLFYIAFYAAVNRASLDPADLPRRCAESRPTWQSYQEDIKGQIGAAAAAEWRGAPIRFKLDQGAAYLTMRLEGPWTEFPCGIPVLLRDPQGNTVQDSGISTPGAERTYTFPLKAGDTPPWVEIHYPHQERRLALGPDGAWEAPPATP